MNTLTALCVAKNFNFGPLKESISGRYYCSIYRDIIHIRWEPGDIFIFSYGVLVIWGFPREHADRLLSDIKPFEQEPFTEYLSDEFTFSVDRSSRIKDDHISLASDDIEEKLAISHGIAQSVKLEEFELSAERTIAETSHIPHNMASSGRSRLSRKKISMMRGNLYLVQSDINLRFNLLDTPEFFWEYPEVERYYEMMARYLDVKLRIEILNKKVEVIHELFSMLAAEQYHKHSSTLEWIIIALIAIEIFFFMVHDIFKLF
jgi:uncharacterized Rmd1/YagE family protein